MEKRINAAFKNLCISQYVFYFKLAQTNKKRTKKKKTKTIYDIMQLMYEYSI